MYRILGALFFLVMSTQAHAVCVLAIGQDSDGDGVDDACDVCPGYDDNGPDADGDWVPDACDVCPGSDDVFDSDGDGVPNGCDLCPGGDDTFDFDGDGVPDGCDLCPGGDDAYDSDGDGVPDGCDLCPGGDDTVDSDADGVPNFCDPTPHRVATLSYPTPGLAGVNNGFDFTGASSGDTVRLFASTSRGFILVPGCAGASGDLVSPTVMDNSPADLFGDAALDVTIPAAASGMTLYFQAVAKPSCMVSQVVTAVLP